jgi:hypothetical protein
MTINLPKLLLFAEAFAEPVEGLPRLSRSGSRRQIGGLRGHESACEKTAKRNGAQPIENKRFGEIVIRRHQ